MKCATRSSRAASTALCSKGYAKTEEEAREKLRSGEIEFHSANDYHIVAPGSGIATPSLIVNIVEDRNTGSRGFCAPFEGPNRGGLGGWGIYNLKTYASSSISPRTLAPHLHQSSGRLPVVLPFAVFLCAAWKWAMNSTPVRTPAV